MYFYIDGMWARAEDSRNRTLSDLHAFEYPPSGRTGTLSNSYLVIVPAFECLSYRACDSTSRFLACLSSHAKYKLQHDLMWNLHMHTDTQASNAASKPCDWHLVQVQVEVSWSVSVLLRTQARQPLLQDIGKCRRTLITRSGSCAPSSGWHYGWLSSMRPLGKR